MNLFQRSKNSDSGNQQPTIQARKSPDKASVRRRYHFYGHVQGVGFRYEAMGLASRLSLVGWVKNEKDGSVILEIEGSSNLIDSFIMAIEAIPRFSIVDIKTENLPPLGIEASFRLLF